VLKFWDGTKANSPKKKLNEINMDNQGERIVVATLALGSRPRQGLVRVWTKRET
jgi:hypothetical protein